MLLASVSSATFRLTRFSHACSERRGPCDPVRTVNAVDYGFLGGTGAGFSYVSRTTASGLGPSMDRPLASMRRVITSMVGREGLVVAADAVALEHQTLARDGRHGAG
jgi:hypothetical protein